MTDEEYQKLNAIVESTAKILGEQFDSVLILASALDGEHTQNFSARSGNINAVNGHAADYAAQADEQARENMRIFIRKSTGDDNDES